MMNNESKTSLIRHVQRKYMSLMEINNIIFMLHTGAMSCSGIKYSFHICYLGSFPMVCHTVTGWTLQPTSAVSWVDATPNLFIYLFSTICKYKK